MAVRMPMSHGATQRDLHTASQEWYLMLLVIRVIYVPEIILYFSMRRVPPKVPLAKNKFRKIPLTTRWIGSSRLSPLDTSPQASALIVIRRQEYRAPSSADVG